jgi:hypothetical protein
MSSTPSPMLSQLAHPHTYLKQGRAYSGVSPSSVIASPPSSAMGQTPSTDVEHQALLENDEAQRLSVLVQTDTLLDDPRFDPLHAGVKAGKTGLLAGTGIGLLATPLVLWQRGRHKSKHPGKPHPHYMDIPFESYARAFASAKGGNIKNVAGKMAFGMGVSAALGGVLFAPIVGFLMVANSRGKLMNIRRSSKEEYSTYEPDFLDRFFTHIHYVQDPIREYNQVRKELTDPVTAAQNGFYTAVIAKLFTLGSKVAGVVALGGLVELARYSMEYNRFRNKLENPVPLNKTKAQHEADALHDFSIPLLKKPVSQINARTANWNAFTNAICDDYSDMNTTNEFRQHFDKLSASLQKCTTHLKRGGPMGYLAFVTERLRWSPITHTLAETGKHVVNPFVLANFILTPIAVGTGLIPFFIKEVGIEPYSHNNPEGNRWQKFRHRLHISLKKTFSDKSPASSP